MKKTSSLLLAASLALPAWVLAPGYLPQEKRAPFLRRNFAHRGLYEKDQSVPENSMTAFRLACEAGYGIELDIQLSKDGRVVVFHDDEINRACMPGEDAPIRADSLTWEELQLLNLFGTDEMIPLFADVLALVAGRVPLIVELKTSARRAELCESAVNLLSVYDGPFCVESFDPRIVSWFRFHAPDIVRGQLAEQPSKYVTDEKMSTIGGAFLGNTLGNFAARPHFIAYRLGPKPSAVRIAELMGAMKFGWTSHAPTSEQVCDAVIFEHYRPEPRF